jgi:hypothetical protein
MGKVEVLSLTDFSKGLASRAAPDTIYENAFSDCDGVDLNEKLVPMSLRGKTKFQADGLPDLAIKGGIVFKSDHAGEIIIAACGGFLWQSFVKSPAWTKIEIKIDNDSDEKEAIKIDENSFPEFVQYGQNVYMVNGRYPIIENDGFASSAILKIGIVDVEVLDSDDIPKGANFIAIHNERLFCANTVDDANGLFWSNPYEPDKWTPIYGLNYDSVGRDDGEYITGVSSLNQAYLYVFKLHHVYRYYTMGDIEQWGSTKLDTLHGTLSCRTLKLFEGALYYLSPEGVCRMDGNNVTLVDEYIQNYTKDLTADSSVFVVSKKFMKSKNFNIGQTRLGVSTLENKICDLKNIFYGQPALDDNVGILIDAVAAGFVHALGKTKEGVTYFGSRQYAGIFKLDIETDEIIATNEKAANVWQVVSADTGKLYFCTNFGIKTIDADGAVVDTEITDGLIVAGALSADGNLYFCSQGRGIYVLNKRTGEISQTNITTGFFNDCDTAKDGTLVFASNNGLFELDTTNGFIYPTNVTSGKFNALKKAANNEMYICADNGIYTFDLEQRNIIASNVESKKFNCCGLSYLKRLYFAGSDGIYYLDAMSNIIRRTTHRQYIEFIGYDLEGEFCFYGRRRIWRLFAEGIVDDEQLFWNRYFESKSANVSVENESIVNTNNSSPYYITQEIDFKIDAMQNPALRVVASGSTSTSTWTLKFTIANYDASGTQFANVSNDDKQVITLTNTDTAENIALGAINKRFVKIKIEWVSGISRIDFLKISFADPAVYESEPLRITNTEIVQWQNFECDYTLGSIEPRFFVRTAIVAENLELAKWVRVYNKEPIVNVGMYKYLQFKVEFIVSSSNIIKSLSVNYKTEESGYGFLFCAIVWKNKYIINIKTDTDTTRNNEFLLDRAGYWLRKSNESHSVYFTGKNSLYSADAQKGIVYHRDFGYFDDGQEYISYFVTKKFRLTNFENLFRILHLQYVSQEYITISIKVNDEAWIDMNISPNQTLKEIRETLTGRIIGQTIQVKVSWIANAITEIHKLEILWEVLRDLQRG